MTGNLDRRMWEHKHGFHEGFTKRYNVNRLVWFEPHADPAVAIARKKYLKTLTRAKKIALIEQENPTWEDLAEGWGEPLKRGRLKPRPSVLEGKNDRCS